MDPISANTLLFPALTHASHNDRLNFLSTVLYGHWLRQPLVESGHARDKALIIDARLPFVSVPQKRMRCFPCAPIPPAVAKRMESRLGKIGYRALDDEAWSSTPAQGRHFRECMSTRLQTGFEDRILVACSHYDRRGRKKLETSTFYALLQMPKQNDGEFTRFRGIFEDPQVATHCLRTAGGRVDNAFLTRAEELAIVWS